MITRIKLFVLFLSIALGLCAFLWVAKWMELGFRHPDTLLYGGMSLFVLTSLVLAVIVYRAWRGTDW